MSTLTDEQIGKFRALGTASRELAAQYKAGEGPNPTSGKTFTGGTPQCTWGQLLHKAGFKTTQSGGSNLGFLDAFIRGAQNDQNVTVLKGPAVEAVRDGMMVSTHKQYDVKKIKDIAGAVAGLNDPCHTAEARKQATWKKLEELADEIEKVFGEQPEEQSGFFATAAEQYLENLITGQE